MHSLKIYAIYSISTNNIEINYNEIPYDLYEFTKEFIRFFKVSKFINNNILFLAIAAEHGYLEIIKYLHQNGVNIHAGNDEAFKFAARSGHSEIVKYLHQNGADISADNDQALVWATQKNHLGIVKYLIENGANKDNALMCAAVNNQLEITKYLVENGANINAKNNWALNAAAYLGHLEIVKYLKSKMN